MTTTTKPKKLPMPLHLRLSQSAKLAPRFPRPADGSTLCGDTRSWTVDDGPGQPPRKAHATCNRAVHTDAIHCEHNPDKDAYPEIIAMWADPK